jgi:hypothetical protein
MILEGDMAAGSELVEGLSSAATSREESAVGAGLAGTELGTDLTAEAALLGSAALLRQKRVYLETQKKLLSPSPTKHSRLNFLQSDGH